MASNYFVYLPENRVCAAWGCTTISTGYTEIAPHTKYPPSRHPDDHHFSWSRGRILQAYQMVLISAGCGKLEFGGSRRQVGISAGTVFLLFPGVWHRFAPDFQSGWTEHWIECRGNAFDYALEYGLVSAERPLCPAGPGVVDVFTTVHNLARQDPLANQMVISTLGLQLLALLSQPNDVAAHAGARLIDKARMILMERCGSNQPVQDVADELGISYPYFRKLFREHTGMSAKTYQMTVRIKRASDFLLNTDKSVKEIAGLLGFHSAFHFSTQFKHFVGVTPSSFRSNSPDANSSGLA